MSAEMIDRKEVDIQKPNNLTMFRDDNSVVLCTEVNRSKPPTWRWTIISGNQIALNRYRNRAPNNISTSNASIGDKCTISRVFDGGQLHGVFNIANTLCVDAMNDSGPAILANTSVRAVARAY